MTDSLGDLRAALAEVGERLAEALGHVDLARARLADAVGLLEGLDAGHATPLVPPQLRRAGDELDRGLRLIAGGASAVAAIGARL